MPDDQTTTDQVREFTDWIREHARGSLNDEMTAALADVVLAVSTQVNQPRVIHGVAPQPAQPLTVGVIPVG